MPLHTYKVQNFTYLLVYMLDQINLQTLHLFNSLLMICEITMHIPPKYHILRANTHSKVYHSMSLHTYTANFAPSSNLQEILLAYKLNSNNPPFAHLFVLIIFEPISHIYPTHA